MGYANHRHAQEISLKADHHDSSDICKRDSCVETFIWEACLPTAPEHCRPRECRRYNIPKRISRFGYDSLRWGILNVGRRGITKCADGVEEKHPDINFRPRWWW